MSFSYSDGALHESAFSRAHAVRLVVLREHAAFATLMAGPLLLRVALEDVELEGRGLLQGVVLHEDVGDYSRARHALGGTGDAIA